MSVIRLTGLIIASIAFLLMVISIAIPYWIYLVDKEVQVADFGWAYSITANIGFWEYCLSTNFNGLTGSRCGKFYEPNRNDIINASAAMLLLGMLLIAGSVVVCGTSLFYMKERKLLPIVGGVCAFFSGTCMLIGVALYGHAYWGKILIDGFSLTVSHMYGPSFYMAIVATFCALVSGGMQIASRGVSNMSVKPSGI
ncbi:hypothetical protein CHS0354_037048 [Potamilus streckersoni]|uniref:Claudin n=1 Tax=Potamilus streckersoni TaxID=2493646 RepID=A0AAE0SKR5_9BIVA|nr:hypothetical protein CHS0354_037048 [Potamilus streckersoni]